jgi:endonuclease III
MDKNRRLTGLLALRLTWFNRDKKSNRVWKSFFQRFGCIAFLQNNKKEKKEMTIKLQRLHISG